MASGTIKTLIPDKGFGFIGTEGNNSSDLFFHNSALVGATFDSLQVGQTVTFDEEPDPRDPRRRRAANVRVAGDSASA